MRAIDAECGDYLCFRDELKFYGTIWLRKNCNNVERKISAFSIQLNLIVLWLLNSCQLRLELKTFRGATYCHSRSLMSFSHLRALVKHDVLR
jgi:hypothetical protein